MHPVEAPAPDCSHGQDPHHVPSAATTVATTPHRLSAQGEEDQEETTAAELTDVAEE